MTKSNTAPRPDYSRSVLKEIELARADIEAFKSVFAKAEVSDNKDLLCHAGYHCGQCIEKSLKAIIMFKDKETYNAVNASGTRNIRTNHDIREILNKAEQCCPGISEKNKSVNFNADKLKHFNNICFGRTSITREELGYLIKAAQKLEGYVSDELYKFFDSEEKNAEYIKNEWERRDAFGLMSIDPWAEKLAESKCEEVFRRPIDANDLSVIKAAVEAGDALAEGSIKYDNKNLRCYAAYEYIQAMQIAFKSVIKAENSEVYNKISNNKDHMVQYSQSMEFLLTTLDDCCPGEMERHPFAKKNMYKLSELNKLRFGRRAVTEEEVKCLETEVKKILGRIEKEFEMKYPDKATVEKMNNENWEKRYPTNLRMPGKKTDYNDK